MLSVSHLKADWANFHVCSVRMVSGCYFRVYSVRMVVAFGVYTALHEWLLHFRVCARMLLVLWCLHYKNGGAILVSM